MEAVVRLRLLLLYYSHSALVLLEGLSLTLFKLRLALVLFVLRDELHELVLDHLG